MGVGDDRDQHGHRGIASRGDCPTDREEET
jgi:hypothetical protein